VATPQAHPRQRAGAVHHARIVGHERQAHGLRAGGNDAVLEGNGWSHFSQNNCA